MTEAEKLASFVVKASYEDLSEQARDSIKVRVIDALGCAIGAMDGMPTQTIRSLIDEFGGAPKCMLIGGGRTAPDRAAFYNSSLIRYLDFNDSYLAKNETCHPSDNLGAVLAGIEYSGKNGRDLMTSLAVAYQVQCRLSDVAPVRDKGFDHTVQGAYAVAAGLSKALGLNVDQTANAIAICGTAFNALRVTRTGALSNWKGLAYPELAFSATHATFLAMHGITGPPEVFEGNKGFMDSIAGDFHIDWSKENLERITRTIVKKYNAEIHSQSAVEGILELKDENNFDARDIKRIDIEIFDVAYNIIGGGEEGDKSIVHSKEQADHSLPYILAVAILDNQVMPDQYHSERIIREDVQTLLRKIHIQPNEEFSKRFPDEMPCHIRVFLQNGNTLVKSKNDYEGFHTRPMSWETETRKFEQLCSGCADERLQKEIESAVSELDHIEVRELINLLSKVNNNEFKYAPKESSMAAKPKPED
jgi:2-methylcitrate dehydratase